MALYCEKGPKITDFHEDGKVERSNTTPIKHFSVDSYGQNTMPFKLITFEMPMSSYIMSFWKINISLLFYPFASEVLALCHIDNFLYVGLY